MREAGAVVLHLLNKRLISVCLASVSLRPRKEGNILFNDTLNTFYLQLYGVRHMVKDRSDSERKPAATAEATLSD